MTGRRWLLALVCLLALSWAIGGEWVSATRHVPENHFLDAISGLSYVACGIVVLDRRPGNAIGPLMVAFAFLWYCGNWSNLQVPLLPLLGLVGGQFTVAVQAQIALAYPTGRLRTTLERVVAGTIYATGAGISIVFLLTFDPRADGCGCAWEPALWPSKSAVDSALTVGQRSSFVLVPLFLAAVWQRRKRATPAERMALGPLWIAVCLLAVVYLMSAFASPDTSGDPFSYLLWELESVLQMSVPIVFAWGLLSARLARAAVGDLVIDLDRPLLPGELRDSLARTLGDPSLRLLYATQDQHRWVDADGRPGSLPEPGSNAHAAAVVTVSGRDGRPVAALIHDPALDQGLVRAAAAAAGIRIENERLHADVRAQLDQVRASRQRIVEAGDQERRRVERNIHDGAQQRLATLALSLAMLRDRAGADPSLVGALDQTAAELRQAIAELRELARGIHPAILTEEGLPAAVESLADRARLPVAVTAGFDARLPEAVEAVAYFVVSESLANLVKHAGAQSARVGLSLCDGHLVVEVTDDGVGGADQERGTGLRGLEDRVCAVGGALSVVSPPGGGTRVRAEIPCHG